MSRVKLTAIVVIALLAVIVVLQNTQTVETRLLFFTISMPRAVLLFVTLLIGVILGVLISGRLGLTSTRAPDNEQRAAP